MLFRSPIEDTALVVSANVKESVTAAAVRHLQTHERLKLMRNGTTDAATDDKIRGDILIGELIQKRIILLPMPIDPHGQWGPMFNQFLFGTRPPDQLGFQANRPNAAAMHDLATHHPCLLGIIPTACIKWKRNKTSRFYGHSHTAPTPKQYIQQQLGLTITKAYAQLLRNAARYASATGSDHARMAVVHRASQRPSSRPQRSPLLHHLS